MTKPQHGDTVKVHYTGRFKDGRVFDSSLDREPLEFEVGAEEVIKGFEEAILEMELDESKTIHIPPCKGYGPHIDQKIMVVDRKRIPSNIDLELGQELELCQENGDTVPFIVTYVSESEVTLDSNNPLAGKDLIFDIKILEIV